jgi:hypothetical protein
MSSDSPQTRIVNLLKGFKSENESDTKGKIKEIYMKMAETNTPRDIRTVIYNAYARIHADTTTFNDRLIEDQNALLTSVASNLPFSLEFAHKITLGKMLLSFCVPEFVAYSTAVHTGIHCTILSVNEHGFSRAYALNAINYWVNSNGGDSRFSDSLLTYLRADVFASMY